MKEKLKEKLWEQIVTEQEQDVAIINRVEVTGNVKKYITKLSEYGVEEILEIDRQEFNNLNRFVDLMVRQGKTSEILIQNDVTYVVDIIRKRRSIIIFGAGHVGRSLALIGAMCGFDIFLVDDRDSFLTPDKIPDRSIRCYCLDFGKAFDNLVVRVNCAIVIVTRGHQHDLVCLRGAIRTRARYIGMIGSRRRVISIVNSLKELKLPEHESDNLEGIHAPIGLDIGARLPEEIAVSIVAQVIEVMNSSEKRV
jgi:xanthine dehydrogenase accessory factor